MTVITEVKPEVAFDLADVEAEMLIKAYVPEYNPDVMTFQEAYELAVMRDELAAYDLEVSIMANLDGEEDLADEADAIRAVNMLLESAALADLAEMEVEGL